MILLTYGQPKSASTYLAEIARRACTLAGSDQKALRVRHLEGLPGVSGGFWAGPLAGLEAVAGQLGPSDRLAIKTHSPPPPGLDMLVASGRLRVLITYRHPGDSALSMFEAGQKARAAGAGQPAFARLTTHREALDAALRHLEEALLPWLRSGQGEALSFDELVSAPDIVLPRVADAAGIAVDRLETDRATRNLVSGRRRVYNFNKGESGRYREAFSPNDIDYLSARSSAFIAFCEGRIARTAL